MLAGFAVIDDLRAGKLSRVLPDYFTEERNVYAAYSSRQFIDTKIARFVEVPKDKVGSQLAVIAEALID